MAADHTLFVRVTRIGPPTVAPSIHELEPYLWSTHARFHNSIHVATRVYTCRGPRDPFELHWNSHEVPGETFLGQYAGTPPPELLERVINELTHGRAVRLFLFNSDSDLCFQEALEITSSQTPTRG